MTALPNAKEVVSIGTGATKLFQAAVRALMSTIGTNVDPHYFKEAGVETGTAPITHESVLEYLEGLEDTIDDDL
jgi:hypothetical protein